MSGSVGLEKSFSRTSLLKHCGEGLTSEQEKAKLLKEFHPKAKNFSFSEPRPASSIRATNTG